LQKLRITPAKPVIERRRHMLGAVPKRISLPENLEFQPQKLLNIKQSIHVEKRLGAVTQEVNPEAKSALKVRFKQKQMKTRMQLFRQQSYQMAQKHSILPSVSTPLRVEEPSGVPLSPIEDHRSFDEETMDVC
uniref:SIK2 kinase n=2 Tax=Gongylonema pulchrum TaxID=637853 RepID=A0A183EU71_9BILA